MALLPLLAACANTGGEKTALPASYSILASPATSQEGSPIATSSPSRPPASPRTICTAMTDDGENLVYPTPSPDAGLVFRSAPESGTNIVYTGRIILGYALTGRQTNLIMFITNDSVGTLPISENDFTFISIRQQSPLRFQMYGGQPPTQIMHQADIAPRGVIRIVFFVDGNLGDIKATWRIKGTLDMIDLPILTPSPLPTDTPSPRQCRTVTP